MLLPWIRLLLHLECDPGQSLKLEIHRGRIVKYACTVSRALSADQAELAVPPEMRQYARVAWTFLNNAGYINFGVAPAIAKEALGTPQTRGSVIVIGAGMAGESAIQPTQAVSVDQHGAVFYWLSEQGSQSCCNSHMSKRVAPGSEHSKRRNVLYPSQLPCNAGLTAQIKGER